MTLAPALAAELRRRAGGDARPPRPPAHGAGLPALLDRRAAARARGSGARLWRARPTRSSRPALEQGRDQFNESRRRLGLPPLPWVHTGLSRALHARRHAAAARVPARVAAVGAGRRAADVGAAGRARSSRRRATARSCSWRPRRRRTPSTGCCAPRSRASRASPVRVIATWNGREPDPPIERAGQRRARPLALLLADDAGAATSSSATAATGRCARADQRLPGRRLPLGGRHGRERRAGRLGRARRAAAAPLGSPRGRAARPSRRALGDAAAARARGRRSRAGRPSTTRRARAASSSRRLGGEPASARPRRRGRSTRRADLVRQLAGRDVGQRDVLEHGAQRGAHGDPDVAHRLRAARERRASPAARR